MKIINETDVAWQLENGLWYDKGEIVWGLCPKCGKSPDIRHVWSTEYKICEDCMVHWEIGSNLCSAWKYMCDGEDFMFTLELLSKTENAEHIYKDNPLSEEAKDMLENL